MLYILKAALNDTMPNRRWYPASDASIGKRIDIQQTEGIERTDWFRYHEPANESN